MNTDVEILHTMLKKKFKNLENDIPIIFIVKRKDGYLHTKSI